jgi:hypothetical protein
MKIVKTPEEAAEYISKNRNNIVAVDYGDGEVTIYEAGDKLPESNG